MRASVHPCSPWSTTLPRPLGALGVPSLRRRVSRFQYQRHCPPSSPGPYTIIRTEARCTAFLHSLRCLPAVVSFHSPERPLSMLQSPHLTHPCICLACSHPSTHSLSLLSPEFLLQVPSTLFRQAGHPDLLLSVLALPSTLSVFLLPESHICTLSFVVFMGALKGTHSLVAGNQSK